MAKIMTAPEKRSTGVSCNYSFLGFYFALHNTKRAWKYYSHIHICERTTLFYISKPVVRCFSQYTQGSFASKELHPGARSSQHLEASTSFLKASVTLWELQLVSGELQPVCWRLQHAFSYSTQHLSQILQIYLNQSALNDGYMQRFSQLFLFGACWDPVIPWNGYECEWKHILLGL